MSVQRTLAVLTCLVLCAAQAVAQVETIGATSGSDESGLPDKHYIEGVPFVSWDEAAGYDYPNRDILNPSCTAAIQMMWRYWGVPIDPSTGWPSQEVPVAAYETIENATLDDIKRYIARDVPAQVFPALTAYAHYVHHTVAGVTKFSEEFDAVEQTGPTSGMLYAMASIDAFMNAVSQGYPLDAINDSILLSSRLIVGYNDKREMMIIHDPTFGPDWEISYDDFRQMWKFDGNDFMVMQIEDADGKLSRQPAEIAHPPRTADHDAAFALFNGYSLAAINRLDEAEAELRRALDLDGISERYAHMVRLELGSLLGKTGRPDEAIRLLRESIEIFPDHWRAWGELGNVYRDNGDKQSIRKAKKAYDEMNMLCTEESERKVASELGQNFFVIGCKGGYLSRKWR